MLKDETAPILQKGDRFQDPITRRYGHYVPLSWRATGGTARMSCTREIEPLPQPRRIE